MGEQPVGHCLAESDYGLAGHGLDLGCHDLRFELEDVLRAGLEHADHVGRAPLAAETGPAER